MSRPEMAVGAVPVAAARRFPLIHVLLLATTTLTTAMASSLFQGFDRLAFAASRPAHSHNALTKSARAQSKLDPATAKHI